MLVGQHATQLLETAVVLRELGQQFVLRTPEHLVFQLIEPQLERENNVRIAIGYEAHDPIQDMRGPEPRVEITVDGFAPCPIDADGALVTPGDQELFADERGELQRLVAYIT